MTAHTRRGRSTVDFCAACKVYLCKKCFGTFHEDEIPNLPPCIEQKIGLAGHRRLRLDTTLAQQRIPVRAVCPPRTDATSNRSAAIRVKIGLKLCNRVTKKPDNLITTLPKTADSPLRTIHQLRVSVSSRSAGIRKRVIPSSINSQEVACKKRCTLTDTSLVTSKKKMPKNNKSQNDGAELARQSPLATRIRKSKRIIGHAV